MFRGFGTFIYKCVTESQYGVKSNIKVLLILIKGMSKNVLQQCKLPVSHSGSVQNVNMD